MIVLEGPDNSGKSTLAAHLSYELGIPVYHAGGPPASIKEMMHRVDFILNSHDEFIFDRIPLISEPVYSVLRSSGNMFQEGADDLYERFRAIKPIVIYCRPPNDILMAEDNREAKPHDTATHLKQVADKRMLLIERYDRVMESEFLPPHFTFDFTKQEHDLLIEVIRNEAARLGHYKGKVLRPSVDGQQKTEGL